MSSKVRSYTDKQLLCRVEEIGGCIPNYGEKYLIIGVQAQEDTFNKFDDKFYMFDGNKFQMVSTGTTNAGRTALLMFDKYGLNKGAAVWKTDQFVEGLYRKGYHKASRKGGGMKALRQVQPIEYYRDNDKDSKAEEQGELHKGIIYANMHGVSYKYKSKEIKDFINGWSFGCQVWNNMNHYNKMIDATWNRGKDVDYALLKEFDL